MKIIFICGSLEPGRDGVGDYTRILAADLVRLGHKVSVIALNDRHISQEINGFQESGSVQIPVLRLNFELDSRQRFLKAGLWIDHFDPDWLSLQFVPFSFNPKGLPVGMGKALRKIGKNRKWHIMFHELWVGMHIGASKKEVLWGRIQRQLILLLIKKLRPNQIHTQSCLYKAQINSMGFEVGLLPLFSNIPVTGNNTVLPEKKDGILHKGNKLSIALFGGVHKGAPVTRFAKEVKSFSQKFEIPVSLLIVGRGGNEQKHWEEIWKELDLEVVVMGELEAEEISKTLSMASYGITTTVFGKVEKSGSVAAMTEHGLKVICVAADWKPRGMPILKKVPGVIEYREGELDAFFQSVNETGAFCKVEEVSCRLIEAFKANGQNNK